MTHLDYTWEKRERMIRKEEFEEGRAEGRTEGRAEGKIGALIELIKDGSITKELAAEKMKMPVEEFEKCMMEMSAGN